MIDGDDVDPIECCPHCYHTRLLYYTGDNGLPDGLYCPICNDVLYDFNGNVVADMVQEVTVSYRRNL